MALGVASGCRVTAIHVDHGQREGSQHEAARVESYAAEIGASFEAASIEVADGSNLEARMRAARYSVLGADAATGHTADDQAETLLINLLRGAGLVGLGAMSPGYRRPILSLRRHDTEAICALLGWTAFNDPSNEDHVFLRNRIRAEVLPLLEAVADRDVVPLLVRTADHLRSVSVVVDALASQLDPTDAKLIARTPAPIAAIAIQRWIRAETGDEHPVDSGSIERVRDVAAGHAVAAEVTGGHRVVRSQQRLELMVKRL
jgi:tRNA(Ile)-lysidine synthase